MKRLIMFIPIVFMLLIGISTANAQRDRDPSSPQSGASTALSTGYSIEWYTIDGGGAMNSSNGSYSLSGTIGQPDAGALNGGSYTLNGGFWPGTAANYAVYLPLAMRN
jgi:hypothetical protein